MLRLLALLLSTASATRLSAFWRLKAADLTAGDVVIPTMARRWEDRAAFRAARELPKLTRTPRSLRTVRTGHAYPPPACSTYRRRRAACSRGETTVRTLYTTSLRRAGLRGTAGERMFAAGLYPGVDYAIEEAAIAPDARGRAEEERLSLTVRPIYPLIPKLEREWPITVPYEMAPRWASSTEP